MLDHLRYDSLGCNGNEVSPSCISPIHTPNQSALRITAVKISNLSLHAFPLQHVHRQLAARLGSPFPQGPHQAVEPNLFRPLKMKGGYHVACQASHGDRFASTVTKPSLNEYGFLKTPAFAPRFAGRNRADPEDKKGYLEEAVEKPYFSMYGRSHMGKPTSPQDKTGYEPRYMQLSRERYGAHRATPKIWAEVMETYYSVISLFNDQFRHVVERTRALGALALDRDALVHRPRRIGGLVPTLFPFAGVGEYSPHCGVSLADILTLEGRDAESGGVKKHKEFAFLEGGFLTSEEPLLE
ncbi:sulfatase [Colletotrichum orchidophilum]|uniref:Sulfatase n=1 Tax=Colletotrichum orchidophilum TaxID=1209926 RepID=A0A1G4B2A2_9PEZI|nr:sulfatase [Colletotrichum orchidophilum]OHE95497.1 sulfatase [Colletotrichum orchidophilum]